MRHGLAPRSSCVTTWRHTRKTLIVDQASSPPWRGAHVRLRRRIRSGTDVAGARGGSDSQRPHEVSVRDEQMSRMDALRRDIVAIVRRTLITPPAVVCTIYWRIAWVSLVINNGRRRSPFGYVDPCVPGLRFSHDCTSSLAGPVPNLVPGTTPDLEPDLVMQHYQPPHLRRQAAEQEEVKRAAAARHASAWSSTAAAGPSTRPQQSNYMPRTGPIANARSTYAPQASRRDWSTPARPAGNVLASPASDLKPMRRTPVNDIDKMDLIQSVSRSGGDGAEGDT